MWSLSADGMKMSEMYLGVATLTGAAASACALKAQALPPHLGTQGIYAELGEQTL